MGKLYKNLDYNIQPDIGISNFLNLAKLRIKPSPEAATLRSMFAQRQNEFFIWK